MALQVQHVCGIKVYHLTGGKNTPQWIDSIKKDKIGSLRYNNEFRNRIDFIQDFYFTEASTKIELSPDGQFLIVAGIYPPSVKVFDLKQLSLYWERRFDSEIMDFKFLSQDWKKLVFLRNDRYLEFHSQFGLHEKIRVPKSGRTITYNDLNCELYVSCAEANIYRLNLQQGQFFSSFHGQLEDVFATTYNETFNLLALGGSKGILELWDPRSQKAVSHLNVINVADINAIEEKQSIRALEFAKDGLTLATGISTGEVALFDIRSQQPLKILNHKYGFPITKIQFHEKGKKLYTVDKKIIRIWNRKDFSLFSSITPEPKINDFCIDPNNGISFLAVEDTRVQTYFIPTVGAAPGWCPSLESLTEELEEKKENYVYTDYKFVTRNKLRELGLENLIGSGLLKAYMHGFFIHSKLYKQVNQTTSDDVYEGYVKNSMKRAIQKKRENRITFLKRIPKFNKKLALELLEKEKNKEQSKTLLQDNRFTGLFNDPDFEINYQSLDYSRAYKRKNDKMLQRNRVFDVLEKKESSKLGDGLKMYGLKQGYIPEQSLKNEKNTELN